VTSPVNASKPPTTRIEIKTDRSMDIKAALKSSARNNPRESQRRQSSRNGTSRKDSVSYIFPLLPLNLAI